MRGRIWLFALLVLPLSWSLASADIRPWTGPNPKPPPAQSKDVSMIVELDSNAKEARLIVPRSIVLRRAGLDADDGTRLAEGSAPSGKNIIVAGVALGLAIACGGIWLVRKNRLSSTGLGLFLVLAAGLVGAAVVWANAAPPPFKPPAPQPATNLAKLFEGKIKVETPAEGDTIKLIVNDEMLQKLVKENPKVGSPLPNSSAPTPKPTKPE